MVIFTQRTPKLNIYRIEMRYIEKSMIISCCWQGFKSVWCEVDQLDE